MKAILADDQIAIRSALRLLLEEDPSARVVGEAVDLPALRQLLDGSEPDLVLLDWELPPGNAPAVLEELRTAHPQVRFVILSTRPEVARQALDSGAEAFVSKGDAPERLAKLLRRLSDRFANARQGSG